jgi:hypothetical protein
MPFFYRDWLLCITPDARLCRIALEFFKFGNKHDHIEQLGNPWPVLAEIGTNGTSPP